MIYIIFLLRIHNGCLPSSSIALLSVASIPRFDFLLDLLIFASYIEILKWFVKIFK